MKFSIECVVAILSLLSTDSSHAFTPPSYSMTAAIHSNKQQQHRLQYVRHEDEMGWMLQQQSSQQPMMMPQQQSQPRHRQSHPQDEDDAYYYQQQSSSVSSHLPPLDYEARVEQRFSRYRRRNRLRHAAVAASPLAYGNEIDRQHRDLDALNHHHHHHHTTSAAYAASPLPPLTSTASSRLLVNTPIPIINFRTNSDFPASDLPASQWITQALPPVEFDDAEYSSCTLQKNAKVLVACDDDCFGGTVQVGGMNYRVVDAEDGVVVPHVPHHHPGGGSGGMMRRAYWLQDKLHNAIYGQVRYGTVLQKLDKPLQIMMPSAANEPPSSSDTTKDTNGKNKEEEWTSVIKVEWMATNEAVAIKEMSWEHIRTQREKLAEDPIKEVAAMQYLERWVDARNYHNRQRALTKEQTATTSHMTPDMTHADEATMLSQLEEEESHIMMPLDLLSDNEHLYSITPYCEGGRLLDILEYKSRFSEPEARYWMRQILKGLSCLKNAGVAHRDMSPENLMVHDGNVYIIDMGMCLRIPSSSDHGMLDAKQQQQQSQQRSLILPQTPCGKWYYLSPEVCLSEQPFDGPAVDLWAAGVILFIMLTGLPPWEEPKMTDENFKLMTTGHLVRILTERRAGLSVDAMDLLQRMFWLDPADRLSLEQVCKHPWMTHKEYNLPLDESDGAAL